MLSAEAEKIIIRTRTLCDGRGEKKSLCFSDQRRFYRISQIADFIVNK